MGYPAQKIGMYGFRPVQTCPGRKPEYFLPIIGAVVSLFGSASKANDKEIAKKMAGMSEEAANKLYNNQAVTDQLLSEMKPLQSNKTFYIITGVALVSIIIIGIILYKRK